MSINLNQIPFQSGLRSTPVNENFTDIQNAINDLQAQLDAMLTPPVGSEVTNARDYHSVLRDRLRSASKATGNVVITGGAVTQQASPNMTVAVAAGEAVVDGVACVWTAQNSGTITAPVSNPRYDVVVINSDNTLSVVAGSEAATPSLPSLLASQKALAKLSLTVGMTQILTANITDYRNDLTRNISTINEGIDGDGVNVDGVICKDGKVNSDAIDFTGNKISKIQVFTSDGTWVKPSSTSVVRVIVVGAGGAGGNGYYNGAGEGGGGGGGGGGHVIDAVVPVSGNVAVFVGTTSGESSIFGSITASGGSAGSNGTLTDGGSGGSGSTGGGGGGAAGIRTGAAGGRFGSAGVSGGTGANAGSAAGAVTNGTYGGFVGGLASVVINGGGGGGAGYGGNGGVGAAGVDTPNTTNQGQGYGAGGGGGGGSKASGPASNGSAGYQGCVIVYWNE